MDCEETPLLLIISASFVAVESREGGSSQIAVSQAVLDEAIKGPRTLSMDAAHWEVSISTCYAASREGFKELQCTG